MRQTLVVAVAVSLAAAGCSGKSSTPEGAVPGRAPAAEPRAATAAPSTPKATAAKSGKAAKGSRTHHARAATKATAAASGKPSTHLAKAQPRSSSRTATPGPESQALRQSGPPSSELAP